jgi:hypothetical protein
MRVNKETMTEKNGLSIHHSIDIRGVDEDILVQSFIDNILFLNNVAL